MANIEQSVEVDVPVRTAYNQWTQFEEFPKFMEGVESVRQLDDKRLRWRATVGGKTRSGMPRSRSSVRTSVLRGRAEGAHTMQASSPSIAWPTAGRRSCCNWTTTPRGLSRTSAPPLVGVVSARVKGDLQRFKEFVEVRGHETGAWRGQIEKGEVTKRPVGVEEPHRLPRRGGPKT